MDTNVSSGFGNGKHRNKEILQYLIPKVVHGLADPLAVGGLVAREARAALAVGHASEDALGHGKRVEIICSEIPQNILCDETEHSRHPGSNGTNDKNLND